MPAMTLCTKPRAVFFDASGTLFRLALRGNAYEHALFDDVESVLQALAKQPHVGCGIIHAESGFGRKPQARIFEGACASCKLPPEQVLFVGDSLYDDAWGAHEAGLVGVWLDRRRAGQNRHDFADNLPFSVIGSLVELTSLPYFFE